MKQLAGKTALVTGAGSGIGQATAIALAVAGMRVAVTDRDLAAAERTVAMIAARQGQAVALELDVTDRTQPVAVSAELPHVLGTPAVLVNNAGIAVGGLFLDTSESSWDKVLAVNLLGVVNCCRAFLPGMIAAGDGGHVVNIASMLGYTGIRGASAYCATKFGVVGFSESLRAEMHPHGIGVSAVCPGMVRTNIIADGILESATEDVESKRAYIEALYARRNYAPERVGRAVVKAVRRNRALMPVTPEARAALFLKRYLPSVAGWLARREIA